MNKHRFNIFPEMSPDEYNRLKDDIKNNGYDGKQPIYLYEGDILDGWNRYLACIDLDVLPPYKDFIGNNLEAVEFVMRTNKRRNLTSSQWAAIAVEAQDFIKLIEEEVESARRKKQAETQKEDQKRRKIERQRLEGVIEDLKDKIETIVDEEITPIMEFIPRQGSEKSTKSAEIIAEQFNTNEKYIREASKLKDKAPEKFEQVKRGEITLSSVKKDLKNNISVSDHNNSSKDEWYTPEYIIESAKLVMGKIDLDPASSAKANETVKAEFYMSKEKGGLDKTWFGNIWLNPPFSQPVLYQFIKALIDKRNEYNQAMVLVNMSTEIVALHEMLAICSVVCLFKGRVKFFNPDGNTGEPMRGVMILYFGDKINPFIQEFKKYGTCLSSFSQE